MTPLQHTPITALVFAAALWLLAPGAHAADTTAPEKSTVRSTTPPAGMPQYGVGTHGRSLTLALPDRQSIAPAPNTPYRLFLTGPHRLGLDRAAARRHRLHADPSRGRRRVGPLLPAEFQW
ncbi:hypothetical protein G6F56_014140 [Rhizopus delemar]|nr:hypothetical protein G6F56_014140 [Rhizopus delemar]